MAEKVGVGVIFILLSSLCYALMSAIVKHYSPMINLPLIIFLQNIVAFTLMLPFFIFNKRDRQALIASSHKMIHGVRVLSSFSGIYFFYYAVSDIPLVNASLLLNTSPLLAPFLGLLLLKKSIHHALWLPLCIGFSGMLIVLHPSASFFHWGSVAALCAAVAMALSGLFVRLAKERGERGIVSFGYYLIYGTALSGVISIPFWHALSWAIVLPILGSGVLWFLVQYTLVIGFTHLEASVGLSLYYSNVIFAAVIGMLVWHQFPDVWLQIGLCLIIFGGIFTIRRQMKISKSRASISSGRQHPCQAN